MKAGVLRAGTKLAKRGSTSSWRGQGGVTGRVTNLAVCRVQLMEYKQKSLAVQGPQKQSHFLRAFALKTWANALEMSLILISFVGAGKSFTVVILGEEMIWVQYFKRLNK